MSSTNSPTLTPEVRARRSETVVAALTLGAGGGAPFLIEALPFEVALLTGLSVAALLTAGFIHAGWLGSARRIQAAVWATDGVWVLTDGRGRQVQAALEGASRVWPQFVWLRWRSRGASFRRPSMLLTRLDLPACDLRRLVVRLRLDRLKRAPAPGVAAV